MAHKLQIVLFGNVSIKLDGQPVDGLPSRAAEALLIYLACHEHPVSRETLAELLWADRSQKQALTNLRTILTGLKRELGEFLAITRQSIAFNHNADYWLDSAALEDQLTALEPAIRLADLPSMDDIQRLQTAVDLYQGNFLTGFYLKEGRGFEEWAALQRERLRRLAYNGFRQLVHVYLEQGEYLKGIRYADRLVLLDPYDEDAHRQMMWLLARNGNRNAALKVYQDCRARLMEDLGVEPSSATRELFERLRGSSFPPPHNLPALSTPFLGREAEVEAVSQRLSGSAGRLVSILGPGGVGKTRLAIESALQIVQSRPGQFLDGVIFAPLAGLPSSAYLTISLGELLSIRFEGETPSLDQLIDHLKVMEMLLVLDNFEHLVDPASLAWLDSILKSAPSIKILLTSRERLRLREEQVLDLGGLAYPPTGTDDEIATNFGSIQLFIQHSQRIQKDYSPTPEDIKAIIQLCQLVDGMPLGIELAAAGVRYFSAQDILGQLREKADLEFSQARDRPDRHQSLQAVFEHSWSLLSKEEQQIARRFSVFHGPLNTAAAAAITGAKIDQLALLIDKSFLRRDEDNKGFNLHPLMQQYLAVKLGGDPKEERTMHTRHADFFATLIVLPGHEESNMEQHFYELKEIVAYGEENITHAALWLAKQHDFSDRKLVTLIERLNFFYNTTQRFENWKVVFQQICEALQNDPDGSYEETWLTAVLEARIAYADINLHARRRASQRLERITAQAYALENIPLISYCHSLWGLIAWQEGEFEEALEQLDISVNIVQDFLEQYRWPAMRVKGDIAFAAGQLALSKTIHDQAFKLALAKDSFDEAAPHHRLSEGRVRHRWGEVAASEKILAEALSLSRPKGVPAEIVLISSHLALVLVDLGKYEEADSLLAEAGGIAKEIKDSTLHALVQRSRGWLAECTENLEIAQGLYQSSLELLETIRHQAELPFAQVALGRVSARLDGLGGGREMLLAALETFTEWKHNGGRAIAHHSLGMLFEQAGELDAAEDAYRSGLAAAHQGQEYYFGAQIALELAHLWAKRGDGLQALALLVSVQNCPAITARDKIRASALGNALDNTLGPTDLRSARAWGKRNNLAEAIKTIVESQDGFHPNT